MGKTAASRTRKTPPSCLQISSFDPLQWEEPRLIDSLMSRKRHCHGAVCLLPTAKILIDNFLLKRALYRSFTSLEGDRNKTAAYRALYDISNRFGNAWEAL